MYNYYYSVALRAWVIYKSSGRTFIRLKDEIQCNTEEQAKKLAVALTENHKRKVEFVV